MAEMEELLADAAEEDDFEQAGAVSHAEPVSGVTVSQLPSVPATSVPAVTASQLPSVPSHSPAAQQSAAERDLAALQADFMI